MYASNQLTIKNATRQGVDFVYPIRICQGRSTLGWI